MAGEGGSVFVAAALGNDRPAALAAEGLARPAETFSGIPVHPLDALPEPAGIDRVVVVEAEEASVTAVTQWAERHGVTIERASVPVLDPPEGIRVVAVSAVSTGSGKTPLSRRIARGLRRSGVNVACVRHPLPNLLLWEERSTLDVLRAAEDLIRPRPIEEAEEVAPVLGTGAPVATGLDPTASLDAAAREAAGGVVLWDGGGAARPWVRPDIHLLVVDLLRPLPADAQSRVEEADVLVLSKADTASDEHARELEALVREWNPGAKVYLMDLPPSVPEGPRLVGRRVIVVEDWQSLLLGGLRAGAGAVVARRFRCGVVDPRPFSQGSVATALERHSHIGPVVPALGRTREEIAHLAATVSAMPGEAIVWGSAASPEAVLLTEQRPVLRVFPEMMEVAGGSLQEVFRPIIEAPR